jgi:Mg2+/Co2+ transporter CorC
VGFLATSGTSAYRPGGSGQQLTLRGLVAGHKLIAVATAASFALLVAMLLLAVLGPKAGAITDSTTCSDWGNATWREQTAFAQRYVDEHGPVAGHITSTDIINLITNECLVASGEDVDDTTSIVQAMTGNF